MLHCEASEQKSIRLHYSMKKLIKSQLGKLYYSKKFNKYALRAYSQISPPPFKTDNSEFHHDMWIGVSTFYGQNGRQIGENNTAPKRYKENIDTQHKEISFEGSRKGLLANMTALRHVLPVWQDALQLTTALRNDFIKIRNIDSKRLNLRQGYAFSKIGSAFPSYLARRRIEPVRSGDLPPLETAFFTLGVGVFMVVRQLMEAGDLSVLDEEPISAERLYDVTDKSGALVTSAGKGCAGSKKMIIEYIDVAMNGSYKGEEYSADVYRATKSIGDLATFYDYLYAGSRLELFIRLNQYLCAQPLLAIELYSSDLTIKEKRLLDKTLFSSKNKLSEQWSDSVVMDNVIRITLALLEEMDCHTIAKELKNLSLPSSENTTTKSVSANVIAAQAGKIRLVTELIHSYCIHELDIINRSLGRKNSAAISLDDMYNRTTGPYTKPLIEMLENRH